MAFERKNLGGNNGQRIVDTENGQFIEGIEENDPMPEWARENPSDLDLGEEHRASNPAPDEVVELRGTRSNSHKQNTDMSDDSKMMEDVRENAALIGSDVMRTLKISGATVAGEAVAAELSDRVAAMIESENGKKAVQLGVPVAGSLATLYVAPDSEVAQGAAVGMGIRTIRTGLNMVLPKFGGNDGTSSGNMSGRKSLAGRPSSARKALPRPTSGSPGRTQVARGTSGTYTSNVTQGAVVTGGSEREAIG